MIGRYLALVFAKAFRPTVRWTEALQILAASIIPAAFRLAGAPMPDSTGAAVLAYIAYAMAALAALRLLFAAPYQVWADADKRARELNLAISSPEHRARMIIETELNQDRICAFRFITSYRMSDTVRMPDKHRLTDFDDFRKPISKLEAADPSLSVLVEELESLHHRLLSLLRNEANGLGQTPLVDHIAILKALVEQWDVAKIKLQNYLMLKS